MKNSKDDNTLWQSIADRYVKSADCAVYTAKELVDYALDNNLVEPSRELIGRLLMVQCSEGLRSHVTTDSQGRQVRLRISFKSAVAKENGGSVQQTFWVRIEDADESDRRKFLVSQRARCQADIDSLAATLDYINVLQRREGKREIQMDLSFGPRDIDDLEQTA